jgi:hypothetical protein
VREWHTVTRIAVERQVRDRLPDDGGATVRRRKDHREPRHGPRLCEFGGGLADPRADVRGQLLPAQLPAAADGGSALATHRASSERTASVTFRRVVAHGLALSDWRWDVPGTPYGRTDPDLHRQRRIRVISGSTTGSVTTVAGMRCPKYSISTAVPGTALAGSHA